MKPTSHSSSNQSSQSQASPPRTSSAQPGSQARGSRRDRHWLKEIGRNDRFIKVAELLEAAQTVWVVWDVVDQPGLPRHLKLIQESERRRVVTVSVSALADRRLYRRLDPAPVPLSADQRVILGNAGDTAGESGTGLPVAGANLLPFLRNVREPDDEVDESERQRR